jgi:hypothetical protein
MCAAATSGGHVNIIESLRMWKCPWDETTCLKTAEGGHAKVLAHAVSQGCSIGDDVLPAIVESKSLASLVLFNERGLITDEQMSDVVHDAAFPGSIEMLDYLLKEKFDFKLAFGGPCKAGHVFVLDYLTMNDVPFSWIDGLDAISLGHIPVLDWFINQDCIFDGFAWLLAVVGGHIPVMERLRARHTPWNALAWTYVSMSKNPQPVMDWIERHGYPRQ